jgi:hypothetical protein
VTNAETSGRFVGEMPMALNGDQLVRRADLGGLHVRVKLIERLTADPARTAVFEKKDRTLAGFGNRRVQFVDVQEVL